MRLTVLGSGAACAGAGGNSSGYLVEEAGVRVLLDCGHGVASTLVGMMPASEIDHIFISHMHADHFIDLLPLRFAVTKDMGGLSQPQGCLHLPPGGAESLAQLLDAVCFPRDFFEVVWQVCEYQAGESYELANSLRARLAGGLHYIPGWGIRLDGSSSLTYTGDTAPSPSICDLARGSDLLLAEATLDEPEDGPVQGHLTATQAAELAQVSGVRRLMLTHFWHDADRELAARAARQVLDCAVMVAQDGLVLEF
ncbi:MAG: MBL fold metallo-hydrolase [Chloroflexi bacterium]|nr:MBL fold metallo-hydrolase [Chloroflexota bacterium]